MIESEYLDQNTTVVVYDLQGRRVFKKDYVEKSRIEVNAKLPTGVYLVAVINSNNRAALKLQVKSNKKEGVPKIQDTLFAYIFL